MGTVVWTAPTGHTHLTYPGSKHLFPKFTPCGPDCTTASGDWKAHNWEFHLSNGRWSYNGQIEQECDAGGTVPETVSVRFDAVTLFGDGQLAFPTGCGPIRPGTAMQYVLLLSKVG